MAKITREQFNKWNEQAKNGFQFDLQYFLTWSEKTLTKKVKMDNGDVIEFKIEYDKEFETITNGWGVKYNQETGRYIPMLYITHWRPSASGSGCYTSQCSQAGSCKPPPEKREQNGKNHKEVIY